MQQNFFDELNRKLVDAGVIRYSGPPVSRCGLEGFVHYRLYDEWGNMKAEGTRHNLVTSVGDMFFAQFAAGVAAVGSIAYATLGVSTVAPVKANVNVNSAIATSSRGISGSYPQRVNSFGTGAGEWAVWRYEWAAGVTTNGSIGEVGVWTSAASFVAHALLDPVVNKTANDTLQVDHGIKFLGS